MMTTGRVLGLVRLALLLFLALGAASSAQAQGDGATMMLRAQLAQLSARNDFAIEGLDRLVDAPAGLPSGDLRQQIETLLAGHNHMLMMRSGGTVARVVVLGPKAAPGPRPDRVTFRTTRDGGHHVASAVLAGAGRTRINVAMLIDTGATTIVLPTSMIERLGYHPDDLADAVMQTANGRVMGKNGVLASVTIGNVTARDVAVSFVDDERLGGKMLLGMSFLGRFRMTIDDARNSVTLVKTNSAGN